MPITQDRMLSVLSAASHYVSLLKDLKAAQNAIYHEFLTKAITAEEALLRMWDLSQRLRASEEAQAILTIEIEHFRHVRLDNERRRRKRAIKRGLSPATQGPKHTIENIDLEGLIREVPPLIDLDNEAGDL